MKRLLTLLALACAAATTFGATLNPIQLLNPAGSTSGQAIVSTGASSAPAWGNVTATSLAAQAANTVVANVTGSSASPTAAAVPNCSGTSSALTYTGGSGFSCNATINALTLGGATFASPGPIGSTSTSSGAFSSVSTPSATIGGGTINNTAIGGSSASSGAFTTLSASGNDALLYTNTSGQSIPNNANTTVTTWTKTFDRVNTNFNASTGIFTAPATGFYRVDAQVMFNSSTTAVGNDYSLSVLANGVTIAIGDSRAESTSSIFRSIQVHTVASLTAGQTIGIQAFQSTGVALTLSTAAGFSYLSIQRVP